VADIAAIRAGLANNLSALPDVQVSAYMLSDPTPPTAHIVPARIDFDQAMGRGLDRIEMNVQLFVGLISDIGAQQTLDQYRAGSGALSVKQAIESDRTLAGAVGDLHVMTASQPQLFTGGSHGPLLMCEWTVEVYAHG
jgi:hypothetical protein